MPNSFFSRLLGDPNWGGYYKLQNNGFHCFGDTQVESTIDFLTKEVNKAFFDNKGEYWNHKIEGNPIILAWGCMLERLKEKDSQIKLLKDELAKSCEARDFYQGRYQEAYKGIIGTMKGSERK